MHTNCFDLCLWLSYNYCMQLAFLYNPPSHTHTPLQKKAVAAGPSAGDDDLQARLDQLRRGDDD